MRTSAWPGTGGPLTAGDEAAPVLGAHAALAAVAIDLAIVAAHLLNLGGLPVLDRSVPILDITAERSVATWWASTKLALVGAILALLAVRMGRSRRTMALFAVASLLLFFLSLDEVVEIHEYLGRRTRSEALPVTGLWPFAFGALGLAAAAVLAVAGRGVWRADPIAAVCLAGGLAALTLAAAGLDLVLNVAPSESVVAQAFSFAEELGELLAASAMLYGAWRFAARPNAPP